jgi:hypothetical protein
VAATTVVAEVEWVVEVEEAGSEVGNNSITQMVVVEVDISNKIQEAVVNLTIREEATHNRQEATLTRWEIAHKEDSNLKISPHLLEEALQITKLSCADISNFVSKRNFINPFSRRQLQIRKQVLLRSWRS